MSFEGAKSISLYMDPYDNPPPNAPAKGEPMFNVPFMPLMVAAGLIALYFAQRQLPDGGMSWGMRPVDLQQGYYGGLFTHMVVHGGWLHVLMNAFAVVAFGSPVARDFDKPLGPTGWLAFFIVCGLIAGAGYAALHAGDTTPVVGASGAAFGLIGASLRLMAGPGFLIPIFHPAVLRASAAWMGVNLLTGLLGSTLSGQGASIAWEAHAVGFVAGIILIGPFHAIFSRKNHPLLANHR
ncbi:MULTISPECIES: rhomboid family intramembrane serine protease [unclassified Brevundimonas]|uniref:rhomboid family intramembrane serine protease n=1 Tax=unclassified Brevundimonas TaxID=2622653 RepID=UPI0025C51A92|nr:MULTISPECIES: rhomboid family intramembrane serine protease [unclassified Brevundimonas]